MATSSFPTRSIPGGWGWTYETPADGKYALEFRYAIRSGLVSESERTVNGAKLPFLLRPTGGATSGAWDRKVVTLRRGSNRLDLLPTPPSISTISTCFRGEPESH